MKACLAASRAFLPAIVFAFLAGVRPAAAKEPFRLNVQVNDDGGTPVAGANVEVEESAAGRTDGGGRVVLNFETERGLYLNVKVRADGFAEDGTQFMVPLHGAFKDLDFALKRVAAAAAAPDSVRLIVTVNDGETLTPLTSARVTLAYRTPDGRTGDFGDKPALKDGEATWNLALAELNPLLAAGAVFVANASRDGYEPRTDAIPADRFVPGAEAGRWSVTLTKKPDIRLQKLAAAAETVRKETRNALDAERAYLKEREWVLNLAAKDVPIGILRELVPDFPTATDVLAAARMAALAIVEMKTDVAAFTKVCDIILKNVDDAGAPPLSTTVIQEGNEAFSGAAKKMGPDFKARIRALRAALADLKRCQDRFREGMEKRRPTVLRYQNLPALAAATGSSQYPLELALRTWSSDLAALRGASPEAAAQGEKLLGVVELEHARKVLDQIRTNKRYSASPERDTEAEAAAEKIKQAFLTAVDQAEKDITRGFEGSDLKPIFGADWRDGDLRERGLRAARKIAEEYDATITAFLFAYATRAQGLEASIRKGKMIVEKTAPDSVRAAEARNDAAAAAKAREIGQAARIRVKQDETEAENVGKGIKGIQDAQREAADQMKMLDVGGP